MWSLIKFLFVTANLSEHQLSATKLFVTSPLPSSLCASTVSRADWLTDCLTSCRRHSNDHSFKVLLQFKLFFCLSLSLAGCNYRYIVVAWSLAVHPPALSLFPFCVNRDTIEANSQLLIHASLRVQLSNTSRALYVTVWQMYLGLVWKYRNNARRFHSTILYFCIINERQSFSFL